MLKKIPVSELSLGMHIHKFCRPWNNDPFWVTHVETVLHDSDVLKRIQSSDTLEVWIDTRQGRDHMSAPTPTPAHDDEATVSLEQEVERAKAICGKARDVVMNMFTEARMGQAMKMDNVDLMVEEISNSILRHPHALISLSRLKTSDEYTYMHSVAVCALMVALAKRMGMKNEQVREAGVAGLMHDVGKMMIAPEVLNKPGRLTVEEFTLMKTHPEQGLKILEENLPVAALVMDVCLHHHEKVDGSGYPDGLQGSDISIFARMSAVCDVYDAITSDRPYKKGWGVAHSIREMASWKGHFDDMVFQNFVKTVGIYPVGALVRLESGRLGVVMEQNETSLLTPRVKVFMSARTRKTFAPQIIDLANSEDRDAIIKIELPADWGLDSVDHLWSGIRPGQAASD
ncbi:HD-GYP domain-containing protein [Pseudomonas alliivorans]|uniref:HD-GYP domain-containing protein n=1 Tax=Pseudomonas alliivorans TaxID=2810613 RepID=UPI00211CE569|nr:HD-GYP domain-containing protein [Pseudomonas alliivorans]MCQ9473165.1 HD-GYP domain-containing protein [Pseudomonas alliivorans]